MKAALRRLEQVFFACSQKGKRVEERMVIKKESSQLLVLGAGCTVVLGWRREWRCFVQWRVHKQHREQGRRTNEEQGKCGVCDLSIFV